MIQHLRRYGAWFVALVLCGAVVLPAGYPLAALADYGVTQTCVIVTVRDGGGALEGVTVTRDGGNAKSTDASGRLFWCLLPNSTGTTLAIPGGTILSATGRDCRPTVTGGRVAVTWTAGAHEYVYVDLVASVVVYTPTPTATNTPAVSPTPSRIPTTWETHVPDNGVPYVRLEITPLVQTGRFAYRWTPNQCEVTVLSADGESFGQHGENTYEGTGWTQFYIELDPELYPPTLVVQEVTRIVTATPEHGETPQQTPTVGPSATIEPTPPDGAPEELTLNEDIERLLNRCEAETGERPFIVWVIQVEVAIKEFLEVMGELDPDHPYLIWWN